jgi:alpha-galactosidase
VGEFAQELLAATDCFGWLSSIFARVCAQGVDFVKDDDCGSCGADTTLEAYAAMQQGIWASGRSMVLSIEGQPDPKQASECGHGQMRRVGHDMVNTYKSAIGLVDLGSRLYPFAHNGSKYNATCGGFWNDLEILHIGDGEFAHSYNGPEGASPGSVAANAHFTMWIICKAPLLLGMDFTKTAPETLALVKNAEAIAVNQDVRSYRRLFDYLNHWLFA